MALFGIGKNKKAAERKGEKAALEKKEVKAPARARTGAPRDVPDVLVRPRITEKAASMTSVNVYAFDIRASATKREVMQAVEALYKVKPVKVNVVNTPAKRVRMRRKRGFGMVGAGRKAYVFLKKGDSISLS